MSTVLTKQQGHPEVQPSYTQPSEVGYSMGPWVLFSLTTFKQHASLISCSSS